MDHYIPCMFTAGPTKANVEATVNYGSSFERHNYEEGDYPDQSTRLWKEEDLQASFGEFMATTPELDLAGLIRAYGIPACPELGGGGATMWAKRMRGWNRIARYEEHNRVLCGGSEKPKRKVVEKAQAAPATKKPKRPRKVKASS